MTSGFATEREARKALTQALSELRADDFDRAFARIRQGIDGRGNPVSPALKGRLKTTLRAALNVAVERGLVHLYPAQHVEVAAHARPAVHVWDALTTGRFLDATSGTPYGALWHLVASFGLRRGEAAGLRWSDVPLDLGVVVVADQRTQVGKDIYEAAPQTRGRSANAQPGHRNGRGPAQPSSTTGRDPVGSRSCLGRQRARLHHGGRARHAAPVRHAAVLKSVSRRRLPAHPTARPAAPSASLGLAAGETLVEVSKRLGHSQLAITADTYTHVLPVVALASSEKRAALIRRAGTGAHPVPSPGRASGDVPTWCPPQVLGASPDSAPAGVHAGQRPSGEAPPSGLEPETLRLTVACSAN